MKFIERVQHYIDTLDARGFLIYAAVIGGIIFALSGMILLWRSYSLSSAFEQLEELNESREKVRAILTRNKQVEQEKKHIDSIINQSPDFNLIEYVTAVLTSFGIKQTRETLETVRTDIYEERDLRVDIEEIDTKQLTEILQTLQDNERVTVKEVNIKRGKDRGMATTIDVTIIIAALYKK